MNYLIVINPLSSKKGKKYLNEITQLCDSCKLSYQIYYSTISFQDDLTYIQKHMPNINRIIAIGGDGLINLVVNSMVNSSVELIVIPCGSGNDFARTVYQKQTIDIPKLFDSNSKPLSLIQIGNDCEI